MKIYIAGGGVSEKINSGIQQLYSNRLLSFYFVKSNITYNLDIFHQIIKRIIMKNKVSLFLDSGAFSAWSKGVEININEYIEFIKENEKYIEVYSVLDDITNPEITLKNQAIMEKAGLSPLPCYHYGEDVSYLKKYIAKYDYIALGGMVPIGNDDLSIWLDNIFANYICDSKGMARVKVHGFGLTSLVLMLRYCWYSVDSTSWVMTSRFGSVYVPNIRNGKYVYDENSWKVCVSDRSPSMNEAGKHINTYSPMERNQILKYFDSKGFKIGESEFRKEDEKYKLSDDERWFGKAEADSQRNVKGDRSGHVSTGWTKDRIVEKVIEPGLSNDYKQRDEMNIIYFMDLEKSMPEWPWPWKSNKPKGFGMRR